MNTVGHGKRIHIIGLVMPPFHKTQDDGWFPCNFKLWFTEWVSKVILSRVAKIILLFVVMHVPIWRHRWRHFKLVWSESKARHLFTSRWVQKSRFGNCEFMFWERIYKGIIHRHSSKQLKKYFPSRQKYRMLKRICHLVNLLTFL